MWAYADIGVFKGKMCIRDRRKIPKMIEGICSKKNCSLNISFTEYAGHASELTRQAIEEGAEYILAVGGDGTVNEIARAMIHSNAILGICLLYTSRCV